MTNMNYAIESNKCFFFMIMLLLTYGFAGNLLYIITVFTLEPKVIEELPFKTS